MTPLRAFSLQAAVAVLSTLAIGPVALAHKDDDHLPPYAAPNSAAIPPTEAPTMGAIDENTYTYFYEIFTTLVADLPTALQQETIDRATAIFPHLGESPGPDGLAAATEAFYQRLRSQYPVVSVNWEASTAQWSDTNASVDAVRGLPRFVLVEVVNETAEPILLSAALHGSVVSALPDRVIPPGAMRAFPLRLSINQDLDSQAAVVNIPLVLTPEGKTEQARSLRLAVAITEPAVLRGRLIESTPGETWPGRVSVRGGDGVFRHAKAYAEIKTVSEKPLLQFPGKNYKLPFFYSDGTFEIQVPPGAVEVTLERGYEHPIVHQTIEAVSNGAHEVTLVSERFLDMKKEGWVSGDTHIHWVKNHWSENEELSLLRVVQRAEDIRVVNNLTLMHRTATTAFIAPSHALMGPIAGYCDSEYHVQMAEEYRNEEFYGHLCFLNIHRLILPISTGTGVAGPDVLDYPINKTAILDCRSQGGISIEAHALGLNWDVPVNVIHKLTDSLDQIDAASYYRFLDCGFRLPLSNGSDHPARLAGSARVYVEIEGDFTYEKWIEGIRKCRTFTTSGPLLFLDVNGAGIGDELTPDQDSMLHITARVVSRHPIGQFQIVSNGGEILHSQQIDGTEGEISVDIPADESRWIAARCSQTPNFAAIAGPNVAHTSAVYVTVNGKSVFRAEAARHWAEQMRIHSADVAERAKFANDEQRKEATDYIDAGVRMFEALIQHNDKP